MFIFPCVCVCNFIGVSALVPAEGDSWDENSSTSSFCSARNKGRGGEWDGRKDCPWRTDAYLPAPTVRGAEGDTGELSQPALHRWLRMLLRKCSVVYSCLTRTSQTKRCETATSMCVCRLPDGCRPGCGGSGLRAGTPSLPRPPALAAVCPQRPSVQVPVSSGFPRCTERVPDSCGGGGVSPPKERTQLGESRCAT